MKQIARLHRTEGVHHADAIGEYNLGFHAVGMGNVAVELRPVGIHALFGVFETLNWIEHHQLHKSDEELLEVKHSLLLAGRLICEYFRRRS